MQPGRAPARGREAGADAAGRDDFVATLLEVRTLAGDMLGPVGRHESRALPLPIVARDHHDAPAVRDYLTWWALHANPSGAFASRTRWLRRLPASWLLRTMFALGYDGLVYVQDGVVIGHVFFQRRGDALHGFSTAVAAPFDAGGYSVAIMVDYLAYASQAPGIVKARVGRGENNVTRRFLQRLAAIGGSLGWRVDADGWVSFRD